MPSSRNNGRRSRRQARADCRSDRHRYGPAQPAGGGIIRRVCTVCDAVSIDLTAAEEPVTEGLFQDRAHNSDPDAE